MVNVYPHDRAAYTQGLIYRDGFLFESTGLNGQSTLRKVRLETGEVVQEHRLDPMHFGEGLAAWKGQLVQLTWQSFSGHYRTVHSGCGSNCIEWAVIDLTDGRVWFAPKPALSCWAPEKPPGEFEEPDWIETRSDSRLLYLHECTKGKGEAEHPFDTRRVYEWRNGAPVLLRTESMRPRQ